MAHTLTISDAYIPDSSNAARKRGFQSIEVLLEAWQAVDAEGGHYDL